jgi:hypothetical protein
MRSAHALLNRFELTAGLNHRGHVKLVLKVSRGNVQRFGHSRNYVGLLQIPGQRLLTDYSLDLGAALNCLGNTAHYVDANIVRGEDADYIDSRAQITNALVDLGLSQSVLPSTLGKGFGPHWGANSGKLDAADRTQRPLVKSGHETGSNHTYLQHRSVPFIFKALATDNPHSKQTS